MHAEPSSLSQSSAKMGVVGAYIVYGEHGCTGQVGFDMNTTAIPGLLWVRHI